jgi:hypothetical protein
VSLSAQILTLFDRANCQTRRPVAIQRTAALEVPWNDWQKERAEIADHGQTARPKGRWLGRTDVGRSGRDRGSGK